jgi:hypothetical protein
MPPLYWLLRLAIECEGFAEVIFSLLFTVSMVLVWVSAPENPGRRLLLSDT